MVSFVMPTRVSRAIRSELGKFSEDGQIQANVVTRHRIGKKQNLLLTVLSSASDCQFNKLFDWGCQIPQALCVIS